MERKYRFTFNLIPILIIFIFINSFLLAGVDVNSSTERELNVSIDIPDIEFVKSKYTDGKFIKLFLEVFYE